MSTAVLQDHYVHLAVGFLIACALGAGTWGAARHRGNPYGPWWGLLVASVVCVLGLTFMGAGRASHECVISRDLAEPFRGVQGVGNLLMTVPVGLFGMLAVRRPLPVLVGVVVLPLGIELTQASVNGLGRVCDSGDAQMNVLGGLLGLAAALVVLALRRRVNWRGWAWASLAATAGVVVLGALVRPAVTWTVVDGSSPTPASAAQLQAARKAVHQALGERYGVSSAQNVPCTPGCTTVRFDVRRPAEDAGAGQGPLDGYGTLSWPGRDLLTLSLHETESDPAQEPGLAVPGAKRPAGDKDASAIARAYARDRCPWIADASAQRTLPLGDGARHGWVTQWRWVVDGVVMPRTLDVRIDRTGRVFQVDLGSAPKEVTTAAPGLTAGQAEERARAEQEEVFGPGGADETHDAFRLKVVRLHGEWRTVWLVASAGARSEDAPAADDPDAERDSWQVDAVHG